MRKRRFFQALTASVWAFLLMFCTGGKEVAVQAASSSLPSLQLQFSSSQSEYAKPPNGDAQGRLDVTLVPQGAVSGIIRPPIDVVFVMDVSGSMTAMKLQSAKSALQAAVNYFKSNYNQNDRFALIPFSDGVREASVVPFGKYSNVASQLDAILNTGNSLTAGGGTNYSAALSLAKSYFTDPTRKKYIIFLTDGMPTVLNTVDTITYREVKPKFRGGYRYTGNRVTGSLSVTYELYSDGWTAGIRFTDNKGYSRQFYSDGQDYVNGWWVSWDNGYSFTYSSIERKIRADATAVAKTLGMNNITLYSIGFGDNDEVDMDYLRSLSATAGGEARQGTTQNLTALFQQFSQLATTPAITGTIRIPLSSFGGNVAVAENGQVWLDENKQNAYISFSIPYQVGQGTPAPVTVPIPVSFKAKGTYTFNAELTYRDVYGQPQPAVTKTVTVTVKDEAPPSFTGTVKLQGLTNDVTSLIKRGATDGDDNRFRATYSLSLVGYVGNATGTISNVSIVQELPDGISVVPDDKVTTYVENGKRYAKWSFTNQTFDYSQLNKLTLSAQWVMQADFAMNSVQLPPASVTFTDSRYGAQTSTLVPPAERIGMTVRLDDFPYFYYEGDGKGTITKHKFSALSDDIVGQANPNSNSNSYGLLPLPVKALQYDPNDDGVLLVTYSNGQTVPVYIKPHLSVVTANGVVPNGATTYEAPTVKITGLVAGEGVSYQYQAVRNGVASAWTPLSSPYVVAISNDGSYTVNVQASGGLTRGTGLTSAAFTYTKLITELKLGSYQATMNVGDTQTIPVTIVPSDATNKTLAWSSSDNTIAVVQNETVTALKPGTVTITVRSTDGGNASATATIRVIDPYVPLTGMAFRNPILYMNVGDQLEVAPELRFIPENATDKALRSVVTSDDRFVKVVQENGKWYLQAVDVGYAIITATAEVKALDGRDIQAEATVIVRSPSTNQNGGNGGKW
ncbi:VWA domain-containing protein [Geobacillus sp. FSL K6-0789]|uniref:VWA domain-containing protein n=1 Tax=Geobacillus stearothermophilus TaxID=1422 RepID=A0A3L7CZ36_GEOSE|nr:VWA domain-containing protein [Geobacillus stearothermophilus]RLQ10378.1 VWA domain-containing protein [Geobacillus stearothermophilus]RLQ12163.1 VWA domain-containing protein [Geobacillus stearothermophilus]RLQ15055.1 VWA domain-containing protein [Geobacillus stearothermophilus]